MNSKSSRSVGPAWSKTYLLTPTKSLTLSAVNVNAVESAVNWNGSGVFAAVGFNLRKSSFKTSIWLSICPTDKL